MLKCEKAEGFQLGNGAERKESLIKEPQANRGGRGGRGEVGKVFSGKKTQALVKVRLETACLLGE